MSFLKSFAFAVLVALPTVSAAADWQLMGIGACRSLGGQNISPIAVHRNIGWNKCRQRCEQNRDCVAVEFNLRSDRAVCELHGTFVQAGPSGAADRVLTCWSTQSTNPG